jgi:hypothetical protein
MNNNARGFYFFYAFLNAIFPAGFSQIVNNMKAYHMLICTHTVSKMMSYICKKAGS